MEKPNDQLQEFLKKQGLHLLDGPATTGVNQIGLIVELPISDSKGFDTPPFGIRHVSKRGMQIDFGDWEVGQREEVHYLAFKAWVQVPDKIVPACIKDPQLYSTSFMDMCWNVGTESVPGEVPDMEVPLIPGAIYSPLNWQLPATVVDHVIDALGKLNDVFLDGSLENAVIYGAISR